MYDMSIYMYMYVYLYNISVYLLLSSKKLPHSLKVDSKMISLYSSDHVRIYI